MLNQALTLGLRDDFAEVYYFFDFDEHSNNLNNTENVNALGEMLSRLDNETDVGKLYVSYPMVEALRDHSPFGCETISGDCFRHHDDFSTYKDDSSRVLDNNEIKGYRFPHWRIVLNNYVSRLSCLMGFSELDRPDFVDLACPNAIFKRQMELYRGDKRIFILSSFPEFLIDYSESFWRITVGNKKNPLLIHNCPRKHNL